MDQATQVSQVTPPDIAMDPSRALRHVLVVDDSRAQVMMLSRLLGRWGLNVSVATSAQDALDIAKENPPDLILSDWVMPEMDGLEFCRAFRENSASQFGYFILLSSKSDKGEIAEGLDAGADDFLTKPVHANELRARINAASRIVYMQRELTRKNGMVSDTLAELRKAYDAIDRDLKQARRIQDSLVPERTRQVGNVQISMLLHPCGHVGGDLVGMFDTGAGVGLYGIDVSGHGICSAMVAARVAGYLSDQFKEQNIAVNRHGASFTLKEPAEVAEALNSRLVSDAGVEEYLTMAFCTVDPDGRYLKMVQAGHPPPLLLRKGQAPEFIGKGGLPIGLINDASQHQLECSLNAGDRLLIYSDGFVEAEMPDGSLLDDRGLLGLIAETHGSGPAYLDALYDNLLKIVGDVRDDDISAVLLEVL